MKICRFCGEEIQPDKTFTREWESVKRRRMVCDAKMTSAHRP